MLEMLDKMLEMLEIALENVRDVRNRVRNVRNRAYILGHRCESRPALWAVAQIESCHTWSTALWVTAQRALQCTAVCCSVLQCVAVWCRVMQSVAESCSVQ